MPPRSRGFEAGTVFTFPVASGENAVGQLVVGWRVGGAHFQTVVFDGPFSPKEPIDELVKRPVALHAVTTTVLLEIGRWSVVGVADPSAARRVLPAWRTVRGWKGEEWSILDDTGAVRAVVRVDEASPEIQALPTEVQVSPIRLENGFAALRGEREWGVGYDRLLPVARELTSAAWFSPEDAPAAEPGAPEVRPGSGGLGGGEDLDVPPMGLEEFWGIVEGVATPGELHERLMRLSAQELVGFERRHSLLVDQAYDWGLWVRPTSSVAAAAMTRSRTFGRTWWGVVGSCSRGLWRIRTRWPMSLGWIVVRGGRTGRLRRWRSWVSAPAGRGSLARRIYGTLVRKCRLVRSGTRTGTT